MLAPNAPCADASRGRTQETLPSPDLIEELIHEARYREATTLCAQRFGASLGRLCMGMLGNQAEVDEVLQEIFIASYKGMPRFKGEGSVRAWLRTRPVSALMPGVGIRMTVDEGAFAGSSLYVFARVLDHYFALNSQLNCFTRLEVVSQQTGEEIFACAPRTAETLRA